MKRVLRLAAPLFVFLAPLAPTPAFSQTPITDTRPQSGVVAGTIVDGTGGVMSGAAVTLRIAGRERRTTTDSVGNFFFDGISAGPSTLTVTFAGFAQFTMNLDGPRADLRIVLQPVPVTEAITVLAPAVTSLRTTTATRTDTPLRDVPQSISIVTRQLIADQTMQNMADVVEYVPGVGMAQGEGHRDAPIFRGNTSTADFLVDGVRDDTQYMRDLYNVERVEVLKGPNGMIFGRGGVGGVINRVTRQADWMPSHELSVEGGSWSHRRLAGDLGHAVNGTVAARVTGVYENSGTYRHAVGLERYGINPTVALALTPNTTLRVGYEFFHDERTTDRGVPSFRGRPLETDPSTFFGSTTLNQARITVNAISSSLDHRFRNGVTFRNRLGYADYNKFYQNLVPGAVNVARTAVALTGYNSGTERQNLFNQTDVTISRRTGEIEHTLLVGTEVGRQVTGNRRLTAFFSSISPTTTSISVPLDTPTTMLPVEFRAAGSDADNHGIATTAAVYVQDQLVLTRQVQAIVGLRYDRFEVDLLDNRTSTKFASADDLVSPRLALVYKPATQVSLYASYARSYLPRAGEQLASLSLSTQALAPENFRNYEVGAKWEINPRLSFTTAVYRMDHGNVVARDSVDPTVSHLVDAERTSGIEIELGGTAFGYWSVHGGYAYQNGTITRSLSSAVLAGSRLGQLPRHTFSFWNKYDISRVIAVGLGIVSRSDSFVATDNTVVLPGFIRVDAGAFFTISPRVRVHVNIENVFDERYFWAAHNNNNIAPGSPRAARVALTTRF